jgi:Na+-translocating ferredoxin:NAD+ oxidoreductase RnfG subunit
MKEKYFKLEYFKPAITLGFITTVISALLIITANLIPDNSHEMTDKLRDACIELMGEGTYFLVEDYEKPANISKIIRKSDGTAGAFEVITSGYNPDSITALVAMDTDGTVRGVYLLSIKDSPGYDKRVNTPEFLSQFIASTADSQFDSVTGATRSSKGIIDAVNIAIEAYEWFIEEAGRDIFHD